jgi:hypothetical protein
VVAVAGEEVNRKQRSTGGGGIYRRLRPAGEGRKCKLLKEKKTRSYIVILIYSNLFQSF